MQIKLRLKLVFVLSFAFAMVGTCLANADTEEGDDDRHIMVSMRMIGHQIMLNSGDSTSRVLPVQKINDSYKITFESEFEFFPHQINHIVDSVVQITRIADSYTYQIAQCSSQEVVHSYEMLVRDSVEHIPCGTRPLPEDCYVVFFHIMDSGDFRESLLNANQSAEDEASNSFSFNRIPFLLIPLIVLVSMYYIFKKKPPEEHQDPNLLKLGDYWFDKINMVLIYENEKTELTGKEADLLVLLHTNANTTVERDAILAGVWKDEGDYIGRTLDVFISKLRKKLSADETVKIVNIRGVGYKLVLG